MHKKKDGGFTLVEMIIVLVILAIVAAIAIPVTLSIIDSSDDVQIAMDGKNIWTAVQTILNDQLANDEHFLSGASNSFGAPVSEKNLGFDETNYNDYYKKHFEGKVFMDISDNEFAERILKKINNADEFQMIYFACTNFYDYYTSDDVDKAYKVYIVSYKYYDDDKVYHYDGNKVTNDWLLNKPKNATDLDTNSKITYKLGKKEMNMQYYCVKKFNANKKNDTSKPFTYFKGKVS